MPDTKQQSGWGDLFGGITRGLTPDRVVYVNPATGKAAVASDPRVIGQLMADGYKRMTVPAAQWDLFQAGLGDKLEFPTAEQFAPGAPTQSPLSDYERGVIDQTIGNVNAESGAAVENLQKAYDLAQPGRDRAALQTKENYAATVNPTQLAAAFSGAGFAQANEDLRKGAIDRDRTLAGLADSQTSAIFQLSQSQAAVEAQRKALLEQAYNTAIAATQGRYDKGVDVALQWLK